MPTALAELLAVQFRMNDFIATANTSGITHEESLIRAVPRGNNMNWVLGHVVATRCDVLPALRQECPWTDRETHLYRRGMAFVDKPEHLPFEDVVRGFRATQERILAGLAAATDDDWSGPAPFSPGGQPETLGSLLMKIAIHEAYHLGQTGILRRVTGKEGAIR